MMFHDRLLEKQNTCKTYYVGGRHSSVDYFYLTILNYQKQAIRENANFICLFPKDYKVVNHNFEDHVSNDMSKEEFRNLCKTSWKDDHDFVVIDLARKKHSGKNRGGLDTFYTPN